MGLIRTVNPTIEPVTVAEAKTHARICTDVDDFYIEALIKAAREQAESYTGRAFVNQTWRLKRDKFPYRFKIQTPDQYLYDEIPIPINPLVSVSSITYIDTNGIVQTWSSSLYTVDTEKEVARIVPVYNEIFPITRNEINAVTVTFVAGYGAAASAVPETFKFAIKMMVAHWYDNRAEMGMLPEAVERLLFPFRLEVSP